MAAAFETLRTESACVRGLFVKCVLVSIHVCASFFFLVQLGEGIGCSRNCLSTKISIAVDALDNPVRFPFRRDAYEHAHIF